MTAWPMGVGTAKVSMDELSSSVVNDSISLGLGTLWDNPIFSKPSGINSNPASRFEHRPMIQESEGWKVGMVLYASSRGPQMARPCIGMRMQDPCSSC